MKWNNGFSFTSWGQILELAIPLAMGLMVLLTYSTSGGIVSKFLDAAIVAFITWMLVALVRWTFIWLGDVFKD